MSHHPQHQAHHAHTHDDDPHSTMDTPGTTHDPVCGHWVVSEKAHGATHYRGITLHFCSASCKRAFDATPERFFPRYQAR